MLMHMDTHDQIMFDAQDKLKERIQEVKYVIIEKNIYIFVGNVGKKCINDWIWMNQKN